MINDKKEIVVYNHNGDWKSTENYRDTKVEMQAAELFLSLYKESYDASTGYDKEWKEKAEELAERVAEKLNVSGTRENRLREFRRSGA